MNAILTSLGIERLSIAERLELISAIWDTLPDSVDEPIPEWHKEELDRRLADDAKNPSSRISWEEVKARLLGNE